MPFREVVPYFGTHHPRDEGDVILQYYAATAIALDSVTIHEGLVWADISHKDDTIENLAKD
jgi:hypothetical protein